MQPYGRTIFSVRIEGWKLWLSLRDDLLPVHALLQSLKHALLSDSLNVPSEDSEVTEKLSPEFALKQEDFTHKPSQMLTASTSSVHPQECNFYTNIYKQYMDFCTFSFFSHPTQASCGASNIRYLPVAETNDNWLSTYIHDEQVDF